MLTRIVLFLLIVGVGYLNYTNPKIEDHKAFLLAQLQQSYPTPKAVQEKLWEDVDYSNFLVCSFMKTKESSQLISTGYLKKVKLVNTEWLKTIEAAVRKQQESY